MRPQALGWFSFREPHNGGPGRTVFSVAKGDWKTCRQIGPFIWFAQLEPGHFGRCSAGSTNGGSTNGDGSSWSLPYHCVTGGVWLSRVDQGSVGFISLPCFNIVSVAKGDWILYYRMRPHTTLTVDVVTLGWLSLRESHNGGPGRTVFSVAKGDWKTCRQTELIRFDHWSSDFVAFWRTFHTSCFLYCCRVCQRPMSQQFQQLQQTNVLLLMEPCMCRGIPTLITSLSPVLPFGPVASVSRYRLLAPVV